MYLLYFCISYLIWGIQSKETTIDMKYECAKYQSIVTCVGNEVKTYKYSSLHEQINRLKGSVGGKNDIEIHFNNRHLQ